jgi:excisionase family DNA binding protein
MGDKKLYSTSELADAAGVSRERVRQLVASGEIHGYKVGKTWVIPEEEARRWLAERGIKDLKGGT